LKKLAKGKDKKKKEKPQWGDGKKNKEVKAAKEVPKVEPFVNPTPKGEKKDLSQIPFADAYQPAAVEAAWQDWWEAAGYYQGNPEHAMTKTSQEEKFIMVIPPPNVTGSLHLGHALTAAVEDTLTRWHRMKGHATLYVPGTDHAGIATQSIVEKMIQKTEGKSRHDLGREEFVKKVWEWKSEYGNKITSQLRHLGSSCDWSRERFTMDDMCSKAVVEAFNRFHEKGLLYRANRLGNWSCALKSAISDIEVDYIELEGRTFLEVKTHTKGNPKDPKGRYEFGTLTSFAYPIEDSDELIVVATTRLETMLGDTAVAVHPEDARYKHLHGKNVVHPFSGRKIPIITDAELVDMAFGTGAVKITPAHDPNDYECGKRHNLEFITVLTAEGAINHYGGEEFQGMMRYDARIAVEEALDKKVRERKHQQEVLLVVLSNTSFYLCHCT
jgi:valyl-tRNA synthetase